jgi:hypothetical protein
MKRDPLVLEVPRLHLGVRDPSETLDMQEEMSFIFWIVIRVSVCC